MKELIIIAALLASMFGMHVGATKALKFAIVSGYLTGTDDEVAQGSFGIGQATWLRLQPNTPGWSRLKESRGKMVTVIIEVPEP